jgi:secondary thiamine-phosphate synthase enzyme
MEATRRMIFTIDTTEHKQCIEITDRVREIVRASGVRRGLCHVMALHATAAIITNENDDPNIGVDLLTALDRSIPDHANWLHDRVDNSETIPVEDGELVLGTRQGLMLVELDGPRQRRKIAVNLIAAT